MPVLWQHGRNQPLHGHAVASRMLRQLQASGPPNATLSRSLAMRVARNPLFLAVSFILLCVLAMNWPLIWAGHIPLANDMIFYFYPVSALTGQMLGSGQLPVWNPYSMSGMPLMGDPQSGWGHLTVMLPFSLLSITEATITTYIANMILCALGMLLFLRATGVGIAGATIAALSLGLNARYNFGWIGARAWLPWLFLGAYMATTYRGRRRFLGWTLMGIAASQEVSAWSGQGAYYAFAAVAAYVVFMVLLGPSSRDRPVPRRLVRLLLHSAIMSMFVLVLSAWTLFPRLEFIGSSNLQNGYGPGEQPYVSGISITDLESFLRLGPTYVGATIILLALSALFLKLDRTQAFYAGMVLLTFLAQLSLLGHLARTSELARTVFALFPGLLQLHLHYPGRLSFVMVFFLAALAGTAVDKVLTAQGRRWIVLLTAVGLPLLSLVWIVGPQVVRDARYSIFAIGLLLAAGGVLLAWTRRFPTRWAAALLVVLTAAQLIHNFHYAVNNTQSFTIGDAEGFYRHESTQASARLLNSHGTGRFFGYYPRALSRDSGYRRYNIFSERIRDPVGQVTLRGLLVASQGNLYGLEDAQGYNPLHLAVYDRLLATANGHFQHYRNAYIFPPALDSPLLDMIRVQSILTTRDQPLSPGHTHHRLHASTDNILHYTNLFVLPRLWVVHDVRAASDDDALRLIDSGLVDPRTVGLVAEPTSGVQPQRVPDQVKETRYSASRIDATVELASSGLLVLSELDYPAWKVQVNGISQPSVRVNGALRGVVVPAGRHTVTWHYDSILTRLGFWLSGLGAVSILGAFLWWDRLRRLIGVPRKPSDLMQQNR